ncbi:MAG: NAD(P)/FAD-dependent oxidoreductase [Niabella sp.]
MSKTIAIIGGGAAGFFCAVNAARLNPSLRVLILEKSGKLLSKVKVSGGGRCNVTHACFDIEELAQRYPRGKNFVRKAFHRFYTKDTIEWFEKRGVKLKTEADGRMFPVTDNSQTIMNCLFDEAARYGVEIRLHAAVTAIEHTSNSFELTIQNGEKLRADNVCIASGGFPKENMFDWMKQMGHSIAAPVPSLFTFNLPNHDITTLMGVSVPDATVKIAGTKLVQQGPLLITHWGLSGPCVLKLSAWGARELASKNWHFTALIQWLSAYNETALRDAFAAFRLSLKGQKVHHKNPFGLPQRLWGYLLDTADVREETRWADLPAKQQNLLIKNLSAFECEVKGKTTFKEEFVTAGGINLSEIDAHTMMSRKVPGLYFAGEVMDVDGITGGFNFQNAWTTGFIAATEMAK